MTTRLIVKNLPASCTEANLRKFFTKYGDLSDATLKYTKEGKFRKFAFVGFLNEDAAKNALKGTDQSFMGTSKLQVEECTPFGGANKPRAWSKYSKESSAYKRQHDDEEVEEKNSKPDEPKAKKKKDDKFEEFLEAKGVKKVDDVQPQTSKAESELRRELLEGIEGDTSLSLIFSGLPSTIKLKNIKEWLNPIRVKALKVSRSDSDAMAFVTFNRPPDVRRALQRDSQFLGGYKVKIEKVSKKTEEEKTTKHGKGQPRQEEQTSQLKEEEQVREKILETGRLFLRNLPFATTEDDLQYLFKKYGEIAEVQVIVNKRDGTCKGFAIVEFVFPESAVAAYSALDGHIFKGRMMHILPGEEKRETEETAKGEGEDGEKIDKAPSFKKEKETKLKSNAQKSHSWNALFLGPNAVADTLAARLSIKKSDLLTAEDGESAGVRLALAETRLVRETRDFLLENGVRLDAFSRPATKRSNTVMLLKNLPSGVAEEELRRMFERFGACKILLPPDGGVSGLIVMENAVDAKKAFQNLAYTRFRNQPLYLEWAPYDAMVSTNSTEDGEAAEESAPGSDAKKPQKNKRDMTYEEKRLEKRRRRGEVVEQDEPEVVQEPEEQDAKEEVDEHDPEEKTDVNVKKEETAESFEPESTLFVKNLAFDTTDASLDALFRRRYQIRYAQVSKKLNPAEPSKNLSMGFGFVQFGTRNEAMKALKEMQGELLDGHSLELKISHRETLEKSALKRKDVDKKEQGECTKLLVRNLPFQAKVKEVESLFVTFGEIKTIRVPRKMGTKDQHRGFGFVEFLNVDEARRAFEALVHSTHLYGRRLVLEWAKEDESVEELREKTAEKFGGQSGAKKKRKAQLDAIHKQLQVADDERE